MRLTDICARTVKPGDIVRFSIRLDTAMQGSLCVMPPPPPHTRLPPLPSSRLISFTNAETRFHPGMSKT